VTVSASVYMCAIDCTRCDLDLDLLCVLLVLRVFIAPGARLVVSSVPGRYLMFHRGTAY
jgi:hypothetical protein